MKVKQKTWIRGGEGDLLVLQVSVIGNKGIIAKMKSTQTETEKAGLRAHNVGFTGINTKNSKSIQKNLAYL